MVVRMGGRLCYGCPATAPDAHRGRRKYKLSLRLPLPHFHFPLPLRVRVRSPARPEFEH